ncbi:MAG: family 16 glycosylhydrolase [Ktedonobacteraceae bacterium]|nr:family 16 glycosylhydrolase [Ktedonobacteraceae bacterium]
MFDDFLHGIDQYWVQTCIGPGSLSVKDSVMRMSLPTIHQGEYADAQIDDYAGRIRSAFPWAPPVHMEIRARSSLPAAGHTSTSTSDDILRGTAGFGFWNYPFSVRGDPLMLPEAIWFFYASPPSNMALVPGMPGWGWKAQVIHSMRPGALLATVPTALTTGWARMTGHTEQAAHWLKRLSGACEALVPVAMTDWHTYMIEWRKDKAQFWVDGIEILRVLQPPARRLGFVAWLDNQYAVVTPRGIFRFGTVSSGPEWFELDSVTIEPL